MYRTPRLVDVPVVVELPTIMYKAPVYNVVGDVDLGESYYPRHGDCKSCPEATALEARQEAVLARLLTLKEKLDLLQSTRTTAAAAAPPALGAAALSSPTKEREGGGCSGEGDLLRQQESVLYRLGKLKAKLSQLSTSDNSGTLLVDGQKITLAERHRGILGIIAALRDEMKFLADLQKRMEQEEKEKEEKKQKNKEKNMKKPRQGEQKEEKGMQEDQEEEAEEIEKHHQAILRKINTLRDELLRMVAGLRSVAEGETTEEERAMLTSVCGCFDLQSLDLDQNSHPPPPLSPPLSTSFDSSLLPSSQSASVTSTSTLYPSISSSSSLHPSLPPSSVSSSILPPSSSSSLSSVPSLPSSLSSSTFPPSSPSSSTSNNKTDSLLSLLPPPPPLLSSSSASFSSLQTEYGTVHDLVVSASPTAPPLSLLVLRHLLGQAGRSVHCASRLHSSVAKVEPKLHAAFTAAPLGDRGNHSLAFSLQWTDTPTPSLMVNPLRQTRIEGEANIVRYISRLFPSSSPLNYEAVGSYSAIAEVDMLLDTFEARLSSGNGRGAGGRGGRGGGGRDGGVMKEIVERLSRQPYLLGNTCSVVDILTWSLLRQGGGGEVVRQWMEKMDHLADGDDLDLSGIIPSAATSKQQEKQDKQKQKQQQQSSSSSSSSPPSSSSSPSSSGGHKGRKELEAYLKKLGINYQVKEHKEVFTVEALMKEMKGVEGVVTKNLFLRDKKKKLYLLSARHDKEVDLKTVAKQAGTKDLRFSDEATLFSALGVKQGCVSGLALLNDSSTHSITFLLDRSTVDPSVPLIHFHPMSNSATLGLKTGDFVESFLASTGHEPVLVDL